MLDVRDVRINFGGVTALDGVSLQVADGEICGLIGPNGAGKTTLFNCITRVYQPDSGAISLDGKDALSTAAHGVVGLGIARTFQNLALFPSMSVLDNTVIGAHSRQTPRLLPSLVGAPRSRRTQRRLVREAMELLTFLDLLDVAHHPAAGLPFGTLKRVELARALAGSPRLLLLDEPAGGLTHGEVAELGELLVKIRDAFGIGELLVEHHMGLVMGISDHVIAMDFGRTIADGGPTEVQSDPTVIAAYLGKAA